MAVIKGSLSYGGDINLSPLKGLDIQFRLPKFDYKQHDKLFRQINLQPSNSIISLSLSDNFYETPYSGNLIVGENLDLFKSWIRMVWNLPRSIDDFKLDIPYSIIGPEKVLLGSGNVSAFFFFEDILPAGTTRISDAFELTLDSRAANKLFLVNTNEYFALLAELEPDAETETWDTYLLEIIKAVGKFSEDRAERRNLNEEDIKQIVTDSRNRGVIITPETVEKVADRLEKLTSFPIEIEELSQVKVAGKFTLNTTPVNYPRSDLSFYHLSVEATIQSVADEPQFQTLRIDWDDDKTDPVVAPPEFTLAMDQQPLIISSIEGSIVVRVVGFDGTTLWRQIFVPGSAELELIEIEIDSHLPGKLEDSAQEVPSTSHRILGQVLAASKTLPVSGLTVVLQAKEAEDAVWRIVSAGETHGSGYFSLKYPIGKFVAAQAIVSVSPDSVVDIDIVNSNIENETLSSDFLYLMLDLDELPDKAGSKDGKISRLPDNADLIASDEYTQDLGKCVNVTTPNRSLREYSYNAIVRISDPDVANYTLERIADPDNEEPVKYRLSGGDQIIERTPVSLSNPIRWQDAPEASDNLSFYQAVTVATGHILFFKSIFKADGYSKGDCVYSLPLAPGQKKQIVSYDVANTLQASESQQLSQGENLSASLFDDRTITNKLSGGISESLRGQSSASTAGVSAGLGLAGTYGFVSGTLGVAGGYANSNSSASQSGSRNITQHFGEKLRQSLTQNAESYRELNASIVTTVKEGQEYAVTTEVVSNHNHCHSVTMMYFEVLRHYAICQELVDVQECLFVPMLLTEFTQENISKWKNILATNLLPIPSNTYLQSSRIRNRTQRHPLIHAFDANERIKTSYTRVDFPSESYAEETITSIGGEIQIRLNLPRPRTDFDRILSLPIITKTVEEGSIDYAAAVKGAVIGAVIAGPIGAVIGGLLGGSSTKKKEVLAKEKIFNAFFELDANFQTVPPAQAIRFSEISPTQSITIDEETMNVPFFANATDKDRWSHYTDVLNETLDDDEKHDDVYAMLNSLFKGRLLSEWDTIFFTDIAPIVANQIIDSIKIKDTPINLDLTPINRYTRGERLLRVRVRGEANLPRKDIEELIFITESSPIKELKGFARIDLGRVRLTYTTAHFQGYLINQYLGDDLWDNARALTPLSTREMRNPRKEDGYLIEELLQHLNSNLEFYNKVLLRNLDSDRRYMLLDGFSIQIYDRSGGPIGYRSLASVIKNELITITGNSLVFPVADGFNVSQSLIVENQNGANAEFQPSLLDRYRPTRKVEPYRLSVPTKGVYMEAVMGQCDACEEVKENSSQDWDRFRTEEPTAISPVTIPTPIRTDWNAVWAQFAQPLVELQIAREAPAPGAGLSGLSDALSKSDAFKDVTGLEGNQTNVIKTYLSNQENAKAFAEMAKSMAMQQHNTENSKGIKESLDDAKKEGTISDQEHSELTKDHLGQLIDGGAKQKAKLKKEAKQDPSLTNVAIDAEKRGKAVTATRNDKDGTSETLKVSNAEEVSLESIFYDVPLVPQPNKTSCWAAAMAMLESYRRSVKQSASLTVSAEALAEEVGYVLDQSYGWDRLEAVKDYFELEEIPLSGSHYPAAAQWRSWLGDRGPLYVTIDGAPTHAIIVRGISGDGTSVGSRLDILNPWDTNTTFDADEVDFNPPNTGTSSNPTVEALNKRFNGGDLNDLSFYKNWRILYQPALKSASGTIAPTGQPRVTAFRIQVVNKYLESDPEISYNASIVSAVFSLDFSVNKLKIHAITAPLPDGDHVLIITPRYTAEEPTNWATFAIPAGIPTPNRLFMEERATITVESGRVTSVSGNNNIQIIGNAIRVRLRPLWAHDVSNFRPRPAATSPDIVVIHHTVGLRDLPPQFAGLEAGGSPHYVITRGDRPNPATPGAIIKLGHDLSEASSTSGISAWDGRIGADGFGLRPTSIEIEIVHHPRNGEFLEGQYVALLQLLGDLRARFPNIVARNVVGHSDVGVGKPLLSIGTPNPNMNHPGRKLGDPGREFDWPRLEASGFGVSPADPAVVFAVVAASEIYDGYFQIDPTLTLRPNMSAADRPPNYQAVVDEIRDDLQFIGYHILGAIGDEYGEVLGKAVRAFKDRFFTGSRIQPNAFYHHQTTFDTARMIKRVRHTIENP